MYLRLQSVMFLTVEEFDTEVRDRELEQTVAAMREALERNAQEGAERVQRALADSAAEIDQLKATIIALRDELESRETAHASAVQESERLRRDELRELQETIQALRAQLEERRA